MGLELFMESDKSLEIDCEDGWTTVNREYKDHRIVRLKLVKYTSVNCTFSKL